MIESQRVLKGEEILVVCDWREKDVIKELKKLGLRVVELQLQVGDFVISEKVGIERKSANDFVDSIISGRLFSQAKSLSESFEIPLIIIEGLPQREISENALKGAIASLLIDFRVTLLNSKNPKDTARTIFWLAKRVQKSGKTEVSFKVKKKKVDMTTIQKQILSSFPGISGKLSSRLLEKFGSLEKIFSASEIELCRVKGVGRKLARKMKEVLRWEGRGL